MHLSEVPRRQRSARPDEVSYSCADGNWTWRQTSERVNRLANFVLGHGLARGDRVALLAKACHRYWEAHFACATAGLIAVPVNYRLTAQEIAYILEDVGASAVLVDATQRQKVAEYTGLVIGFGDGHGAPHDYESALASAMESAPEVDVADDDINVIAYTSGTTGRPKGAMLTHRGSVASAYCYGIANRFRIEDVVLSCMPSYIFRGQSASLAPALIGARTILMPFETTDVLRTIHEQRVTQVQLAPAMINMMLAHPELADYDLTSLRAVWTGGAPIRPATLERLGAAVGDVLGSTYGMTEATAVCGMRHRLTRNSDDIRRLASVGRPMSLLDVEVVREDGGRADDEEVGEIIVRGDSVMRGYWNDPQRTSAVLRDGWYHTGDMAFRDSDGYLFLVDRRVDIINSGGINVYSLEVEQVLSQMPEVAECAVVGAPDDVWGETVTAIIVTRPAAVLDERQVIEFCRSQLAHYKAPRAVRFEAELPRNSVGKLDKKAIRAPLWAGEDRLING